MSNFVSLKDFDFKYLEETRNTFLHEITKHCPEVLLFLKEKVLPTYKKIYPSKKDLKRFNIACKELSLDGKYKCYIFDTPDFDDYCEVDDNFSSEYYAKIWELENQVLVLWKNLCQTQNWKSQSYPNQYFFSDKQRKKLQELKTILDDWSQQYNLTDDWCLDYALQTLKSWHKNMPEYFDWQYNLETRLVKSIPSSIDNIFRFNFREWEKSMGEKQAIYKNKVLTAVKQELDKYCQRIEATNLDTISNSHTEAHFYWLINYQVKNKSYATIGKPFNHDRNTIFYGVNNLAKILDLTLRKSIKGRPKGSKKLIQKS